MSYMSVYNVSFEWNILNEKTFELFPDWTIMKKIALLVESIYFSKKERKKKKES